MSGTDALVVDASVWVAAFDATDAHHGPSVTFLRAVEEADVPLTVPALALVETACAIARRTGSDGRASRAGQVLTSHPLLAIAAMSAGLIATAMQEGVRRRLRGADAIYVATARMVEGQLVAWDTELLDRGGAIQPTSWSPAGSDAVHQGSGSGQ